MAGCSDGRVQVRIREDRLGRLKIQVSMGYHLVMSQRTPENETTLALLLVQVALPLYRDRRPLTVKTVQSFARILRTVQLTEQPDPELAHWSTYSPEGSGPGHA